MHLKDGLFSAFQSISSHKMRSLLTLTGIVIGVLAVVTMFASVYALKTLIKKNMEVMGWNYSIVITPEQNTQSSGRKTSFRRPGQSVGTLSYDDYLALKEQVEHKCIYGTIESNTLMRLGSKDQYVRIRATDVEFFTNKSYKLSRGRYYSAYESQNLLPVAVLGYYFAESQFGKEDPIGKTITLGKNKFQVVGVLAKDVLSSGNGMNFNNYEREQDLKAVYVPLEYGANYFGTKKGIHTIYLQAASEAKFYEMKNNARQLLLSRHHMYPAFSFVDVGAMLLTINDEIDKNLKKWNIALSAIASISLIVGGIGLFSTLLISIQERMMEIGIRKSIGATEADIFFYFISEAISLALMGAFMGIFLAWLVILGIGHLVKFPIYLPAQGVLLGIGFSLIIGFVSGLYPATKASRIDPIQAIYYT